MNKKYVERLLNDISIQSTYLSKLYDLLESDLEDVEHHIALSVAANNANNLIGWMADLAQNEMGSTGVCGIDAKDWFLKDYKNLLESQCNVEPITSGKEP